MNKILTIIKNYFKFKKMNLKEDFDGRLNFDAKDRVIKYIVIHCTATSKYAQVDSIIRYWKYELGWDRPGYHIIIDINGNSTQLLDVSIPSNGVRDYNENSIHLSYIGGVDEENKPFNSMTTKQDIRLRGIIKSLQHYYPDAVVLGHRDFPGVKKDCPSFDVHDWLVNEENIPNFIPGKTSLYKGINN